MDFILFFPTSKINLSFLSGFPMNFPSALDLKMSAMMPKRKASPTLQRPSRGSSPGVPSLGNGACAPCHLSGVPKGGWLDRQDDPAGEREGGWDCKTRLLPGSWAQPHEAALVWTPATRPTAHIAPTARLGSAKTDREQTSTS